MNFELGRQSLHEIQGMVIYEVLRLAKQDKEQAARYLHVSTQTLEEQLRLLREIPKGKTASFEG